MPIINQKNIAFPVPPKVHAKLAKKAAKAGVSLTVFMQRPRRARGSIVNDHILHVCLRDRVVQLEMVCKAHPPAICRMSLGCVAAEAINAEPVEDSYMDEDPISLWDGMPVLLDHEDEHPSWWQFILFGMVTLWLVEWILNPWVKAGKP